MHWRRHSARIELSSKVVDTAEKLRATLLHELCHVAAWCGRKDTCFEHCLLCTMQHPHRNFPCFLRTACASKPLTVAAHLRRCPFACSVALEVMLW
jgi:hypothetical protein